ncbi:MULTISPECIES: FMN-binding negative transcriptional regulator [Roseobacteraceae]|uniref:Protease synthase and sporulation protein PAI 2 n=1 Tax=Pseudosulfitobacter pseudonitzschiae TaxID=1402135 RepID=A0A221K4J7_9RHOB|nr:MULTISPECIES: FMN-binding negative transcriptional regulator [Roseobacteraceae]ASM73793.1 protease synthase and sporulation protein PAI 2 [Pseudosulfitobacter pseudonitzschiae]
MHPNPVFHDADAARNLAFARDRGFGVLAVNAPDGPLISHVPFVLSEDGGSVALHLVRSNPIARLLTSPQPVRLAVSGGDSYVSPDWYKVPDQVPTWNYVAVHLSGMLELRPQDELRALLDAQSAHFEEQLRPKTPWTAGKMDAGALDRMMRQIVPCRMSVTGVDGTWKLSQNKPDDVRNRAANGVEAFGRGSDLAVLAALMRGAQANQ